MSGDGDDVAAASVAMPRKATPRTSKALPHLSVVAIPASAFLLTEETNEPRVKEGRNESIMVNQPETKKKYY